jgi:hypothetical protein
MNCPANFTAHLACVLPHHAMMEVIDAGRSSVLHVDNRIEDGWIVLGEEPGLGISFDETKLAEAAEGFGRGDTIGVAYRRGAEAAVHEGTKRPFERD